MDQSRSELITQMVARAKPSSNGFIRANCLFCQLLLNVTDTKMSWAYKVAEGWWYCARCRSRGTDHYALQGLGPEKLPKEEKVHPSEWQAPPESYTPLWKDHGLTGGSCRMARKFLEKRGVGPEKWERWRIGCCPSGKFIGRVIVPVLAANPDDAWLGYIGRAWQKKHDLPYRYPRGMPRGEYLFNGHILYEKTERPAFLVESAFDAIALEPDAAAVMGKPSAYHVSIAMESRRPIVWVLDGDAWQEAVAWRDRMRMAAMIAERTLPVGVCILPPGKDPDEVDVQELRQAALASLNA